MAGVGAYLGGITILVRGTAAHRSGWRLGSGTLWDDWGDARLGAGDPPTHRGEEGCVIRRDAKAMATATATARASWEVGDLQTPPLPRGGGQGEPGRQKKA